MLLRTENLTKDYGRFRALDQLSLEVTPGEIFGLLGPNGSGKSTALRLLLGFLRPTLGAAWINGHHCWHDSVAARRCVAYLPGELRLYENLTGLQILRFLSDLHGGARREEVDELARALDIDLARPLAQLSSGMKRKVALIQVLTTHAPLLILDEPTNALDPTMRRQLLDRLKEVRGRGQAVLFSSHVLGEVEEVCDRVGILQRGRLVHRQSLADLRQVRKIRVRFTGPAPAVPHFAGLQRAFHEQDRAVLLSDGPLEQVLQWLAQQPVQELTVESVGLESVYARYHGAEVLAGKTPTA
jgi:ABC-2 type transport system ATP-binding protein